MSFGQDVDIFYKGESYYDFLKVVVSSGGATGGERGYPPPASEIYARTFSDFTISEKMFLRFT
jgi:hypothetical protein